jgi:hypothetical protein
MKATPRTTAVAVAAVSTVALWHIRAWPARTNHLRPWQRWHQLSNRVRFDPPTSCLVGKPSTKARQLEWWASKVNYPATQIRGRVAT